MVVPRGQPACFHLPGHAPLQGQRVPPAVPPAVRVITSIRDTAADGGQGLPPEPQGADGLQILGGVELAGGVAQKGRAAAARRGCRCRCP